MVISFIICIPLEHIPPPPALSLYVCLNCIFYKFLRTLWRAFYVQQLYYPHMGHQTNQLVKSESNPAAYTQDCSTSLSLTRAAAKLSNNFTPDLLDCSVTEEEEEEEDVGGGPNNNPAPQRHHKRGRQADTTAAVVMQLNLFILLVAAAAGGTIVE